MSGDGGGDNNQGGSMPRSAILSAAAFAVVAPVALAWRFNIGRETEEIIAKEAWELGVNSLDDLMRMIDRVPPSGVSLLEPSAPGDIHGALAAIVKVFNLG